MSADAAAEVSADAAADVSAETGSNVLVTEIGSEVASVATSACSDAPAPATDAASTGSLSGSLSLEAEQEIAARVIAAAAAADDGAGTAPLAELLSRTSEVLSQSGQELRWLTNHPLWLPTSLAPLFSSLLEPGGDYLLAALLGDRKVLLHSDDPHKLYHATCALKSLISPLTYSHVFIPLLPTHLMSTEEPTRCSSTARRPTSSAVRRGCSPRLARGSAADGGCRQSRSRDRQACPGTDGLTAGRRRLHPSAQSCSAAWAVQAARGEAEQVQVRVQVQVQVAQEGGRQVPWAAGTRLPA